MLEAFWEISEVFNDAIAEAVRGSRRLCVRSGRDASARFTTDEVMHCRPKLVQYFAGAEVAGGVMKGVELACTGKAFDKLVAPDTAKFDGKTAMEQLLLRMRIFPRMSPDGKARCIRR